jgi:type IV pilus assembly protein PilZ
MQSPTTDMGGGARPGVLSLSIKEKSALYAAYMPFIKGGGLFIPTSKTYKMGEEVYMLLSLMEDPAKIPVSGKVIWVTPQGGHGGRTQGIGVQFAANESGNAARNKIEGFLGGALKSTRPTHTM